MNTLKGEQIKTAKLRREDVLVIRIDHDFGWKIRALAKRHKVSSTQVHRIVHHECWASS